MRGRSSRVKGHAFERSMAEHFRNLGYTKCRTSRYESKMLDDMDIDLTNTKPFNIQCKAVENLGSAHDVLSAMPNDRNYNVVVHKKNRKGIVVSMTLDDFSEIIQILFINQIIKP
jgi:hypothetical protein